MLRAVRLLLYDAGRQVSLSEVMLVVGNDDTDDAGGCGSG